MIKTIFRRENCPFQDGRGFGSNNRGRRFGRGLRDGSGQGRGYGFLKERRVDRTLPYLPVASIFKPNGIPVADLDYVELDLDEWEALRLKNVEDLNQIEAAEKMGISQSTFARILNSANKKIGTALVNGCGIKILEE